MMSLVASLMLRGFPLTLCRCLKAWTRTSRSIGFPITFLSKTEIDFAGLVGMGAKACYLYQGNSKPQKYGGCLMGV